MSQEGVLDLKFRFFFFFFKESQHSFQWQWKLSVWMDSYKQFAGWEEIKTHNWIHEKTHHSGGRKGIFKFLRSAWKGKSTQIWEAVCSKLGEPRLNGFSESKFPTRKTSPSVHSAMATKKSSKMKTGKGTVQWPVMKLLKWNNEEESGS